MWRGEKDLKGKTVLLLAEQGLGDTIQFVRYAPLVAALGAKVIVGVQPRLRRWWRPFRAFHWCSAMASRCRDSTCIVRMLSLPLAFATELATIPANIPYLRPVEERLANGARDCLTTVACVSEFVGPATASI